MKRLILLLLSLLCLTACYRLNPGSTSTTEGNATTDPTATTDSKAPDQTAIVLIRYLEDDAFAGRTRENTDVYVSCPNAKELFCVGDEAFILYSAENCREEEKTHSLPDTDEVYTTSYHILEARVEPFFEVVPEKPVIYLYPTEKTTVSVTVDFRGTFTETIPPYRDGWTVTASPDGTLTDSDGNTYPYLFWEGIAAEPLTITEGFCVAGEDTADFLTEALTTLGLNARERADFLAYWLPRMEDNRYNVISFLGKSYETMAPMTVSPAPDCLLRVFMVFAPSEAPVTLPRQTLPPFERHGFTVVEWGGAELA